MRLMSRLSWPSVADPTEESARAIACAHPGRRGRSLCGSRCSRAPLREAATGPPPQCFRFAGMSPPHTHWRSALCSRVGEGQQDPAPGRPGTWRAASFPFPGCLLAGAWVVCIPAGQLEDTGPAWTLGPALPPTSSMLCSRGLILHLQVRDLNNADSTPYPALPQSPLQVPASQYPFEVGAVNVIR